MENETFYEKNIQPQIAQVGLNPQNNNTKGYNKLLVILLAVLFSGSFIFKGSEVYFIIFFAILSLSALFIYYKSQHIDNNINEKLLITEIYKPKIERLKFYIYVLVLNIIMNPILLSWMNPDPYEFGALIAFLILIVFQIIFSILIIGSYEILRKTEKDGSKYNPTKHLFIYNIIILVSAMILLVALFASFAYILPFIKNYESFNIISSMKQNTDLWFIDFHSLYISSILKSGYILLRYIIIFLSVITLFYSIKKYRIGRVCFFWLIGIILCSEVLLGLNLFDTKIYTHESSINSKVDMVKRVLEYSKAIVSKDINSCTKINNEDDKKLCEYYIKQRN